MNRLQKDMRYGPTKLDNRLSKNIQDIWRSNKVHQVKNEKLETWTNSRRKKLSWGENPERNPPGRCAITITICDSDDATELHT